MRTDPTMWVENSQIPTQRAASIEANIDFEIRTSSKKGVKKKLLTTLDT